MIFFVLIPIGLLFVLIECGFWVALGALWLLAGLFVLALANQAAGLLGIAAVIGATIALSIAASWTREWRQGPAGRRDWPALRAGLIVAAVLAVAWATGNRQPQAQPLKPPATGRSFEEEIFGKQPDVGKPGDAQWCQKWRATAPCQDL